MKITKLLLIALLLFDAPTSYSQGARKKVSEEQKAEHLLNRITYGPRSGDTERVMKMGLTKYIDEQLHPERISDKVVEEKLKSIESIHMSNAEIAKLYPPPNVIKKEIKKNQGEAEMSSTNDDKGDIAPDKNDKKEYRKEVKELFDEKGYKRQGELIRDLQQAKIIRATYSERQLQEVMTDFWFNHFNVFMNKGADRMLTTSYERDTIRTNVFGKFETLLLAVAESPAMLYYLDNSMSVSPNFDMQRINKRRAGINPEQMEKIKKRGINENYARELMELHTMGVDGGYTQKDIQEVARCFTGWTIRKPRDGGEFTFAPRLHDQGDKIVLGQKISSGNGMDGKKDGEAVIKMLARHPSTIKFITTKIARKFVSDTPPPSLIEKMSKTYVKSDGDIREVLLTLFNSTEFWAADSYKSKVKSPFEMTISATRSLGADTNGGPAFHQYIAQMGEPLFLAQPPTGYAEHSEHWVNTGGLLTRMNFAIALCNNKIPGTSVDTTKITKNTALNLGSPEFQKQ